MNKVVYEGLEEYAVSPRIWNWAASKPQRDKQFVIRRLNHVAGKPDYGLFHNLGWGCLPFVPRRFNRVFTGTRWQCEQALAVAQSGYIPWQFWWYAEELAELSGVSAYETSYPFAIEARNIALAKEWKSKNDFPLNREA